MPPPLICPLLDLFQVALVVCPISLAALNWLGEIPLLYSGHFWYVRGLSRTANIKATFSVNEHWLVSNTKLTRLNDFALLYPSTML